MATPQVGAALIGDAIGSRLHPDRPQLQAELRRAFEQTNQRVLAVQPLTTTIGDEFQALYFDIPAALAASLRLRLSLFGLIEVRMGIGWGELLVENPERTPYEQDGPCWWRARDALDAVAEAEKGYGRPDSWRTGITTGTRLDHLLHGHLVLRDQIVAGLDATDATILSGLLDGATQTQLAEQIGLHKSSVSRRVQRGGLAALMAASPAEVPVEVTP